jgi:DNA-binding MarR family transcriptional regulator
MSNQGEHLSFSDTHDIRDVCFCLHTQRAARSLARTFDDALRPLALTSGQFSLLNALNRPEPPSMAPVAALLGMDRTTLTAAIKPLERRGLVAVETDPQDRRGRRLRLTPEARALLARAAPIWRRTHEDIEARLGARGDALRQALRDLT